jgi:hypothetical protein
MNLMGLLNAGWNAIPTGLKKFVGIGFAAGIAMCMVLLMFLFWGTGLIQDKLGIPTKADVEAVENNVRTHNEEELVAAVELTARYIVQRSIDSLQQRNDSLFDRISNELIEPGIDKLNGVEAQVQRLSEKLGVNNDLAQQQVAEQRRTSDQIGTLQQQLSGTSTEATLNTIMHQLQQLRDDQEALHQRLKTSKQKF